MYIYIYIYGVHEAPMAVPAFAGRQGPEAPAAMPAFAAASPAAALARTPPAAANAVAAALANRPAEVQAQQPPAMPSGVPGGGQATVSQAEGDPLGQLAHGLAAGGHPQQTSFLQEFAVGDPHQASLGFVEFMPGLRTADHPAEPGSADGSRSVTSVATILPGTLGRASVETQESGEQVVIRHETAAPGVVAAAQVHRGVHDAGAAAVMATAIGAPPPPTPPAAAMVTAVAAPSPLTPPMHFTQGIHTILSPSPSLAGCSAASPPHWSPGSAVKAKDPARPWQAPPEDLHCMPLEVQILTRSPPSAFMTSSAAPEAQILTRSPPSAFMASSAAAAPPTPLGEPPAAGQAPQTAPQASTSEPAPCEQAGLPRAPAVVQWLPPATQWLPAATTPLAGGPPAPTAATEPGAGVPAAARARTRHLDG